MYYLLLFHGNSGYAKASQCYIIRSLPVSLSSNGAYCCTLLVVLVLTMQTFRVCICSKVYLIPTGVSWPTQHCVRRVCVVFLVFCLHGDLFCNYMWRRIETCFVTLRDDGHTTGLRNVGV